MASDAFSGIGTLFQRGDGASNQGFNTVAEVNSIAGPDKTRSVIDVTSLDSTAGYREVIAALRDPGEITLGMNFTRDTYDDFADDFDSDDSVDYQIVLPDDGLTTFGFTGYVISLGMAIPLDDKVTASVTIKIDGQVTMTS